MNYFIIGGDKKEYGPASAEQVRDWVREGRANRDTLLRLEGESEWKALGSFEEFQADVTPPKIPALDGSGRYEGAEAADVPVRIGHAFARAWHLTADHFGVVFGACLLVWLALTAIQMIPFFIGAILAVVLSGPLFGGLFMVFLKLIREGTASPLEVFAFSGQNTFMLMAAGIVSALLTQIGYACCLLPGIYLQIAWLFGIPLVADRGLNFWEGLEGSRKAITPHWFSFFGLFLVSLLPVVVFSLYTEFRILGDSWSLMMQWVNDMGGVFPSMEQIQRYAAESEKIRAGYASWMLIRHVLILVVMPLGVGSFAFVYADFFERKKQAA